jgi:arginine transport system substrate-binding protein
MKKILITVMLFLVYHSLFAEQIKTIRFATEATYPPFEFIDESGQIKGFDIDIAKTLCKKMNAQCTFSNQSFISLIPSLKIGKFDALISALGITTERQKQVAFTNAYYEPSGSFVTANSKHYTMLDIIGKVVGVQQSTTLETYLKSKYGNKVTTKNYASIQDAFLDLISGRVDMVFADTPIAQTWFKQNDNGKQFAIIDKPIVDPAYFGTGFGIAVRKDETDLLSAFNKALADIKAEGTYASIAKKYFGDRNI